MISNIARELSSESHIERSISVGSKGESKFIVACELNNIQCTKSSKQDDIFNHVDYWIYDKGVDIKGFKQSHKEGFVVIEFKNVNGKGGSCSDQSKAEWIAFQFETCFWIVRKDELLSYCRENVELEYVESFNDCYKKLYRRKERKDLMTKLKLSDLKTFNFIWKLNF